MKHAPKPLFCKTCDIAARLTTGAEVYIDRPDLAGKPIWICDGCGGICSCHPGTDRPLGAIADKATRYERMKAHEAFESVLVRYINESESRKKAKAKAYRWLAGELGIDPKDCHISLMNEGLAHRAAAICEAATKRPHDRAA